MRVPYFFRILATATICLTLMSITVLHGRAQQIQKFEPPAVQSTAQALYPINSIASGTVILQADLDKDGAIDGITVLHGIPSLTTPAIAALKKWKFTPAKLDGNAISSRMPVAFTFVPPSVGPRF